MYKSVSLYGDEDYKQALAHLAVRRKTKVGKLIREAIDRMYGSEISEIIAFFTPDETEMSQVNNTSFSDGQSAEAK